MKLSITIEHDPDDADRETLSIRGPICYEPHLDSAQPNYQYLPHVHAPKIDSRGRPVTIRFEDPA